MSLPTVENVRSFVLNYLSERDPKRDLGGGQIDDAFDFLQAGIIDSMGLLEMISAMEKDFEITVDFEQMEPESFTILGSFCRYVAKNAEGHGT